MSMAAPMNHHSSDAALAAGRPVRSTRGGGQELKRLSDLIQPRRSPDRRTGPHIHGANECLYEDAAGNRGDVGSVLTALPGRVVGLEGHTGLGLTRVGLHLLAPLAVDVPVVAVDVRGWMCPLAGWEMGIEPARLITVRCSDPVQWPKVVAALLEGLAGVYAEVPKGVPEPMLRRLAALARARSSALILRPLEGALPSGMAFLRMRPLQIQWSGLDAGHGRLQARRITFEISGKGASGIRKTMELEDDGENTVRVVPGLAAAPTRRAAG
jgi:hypothetical protein